MEKLIGIQEINDAFDAWLEKYGFSARIREMDTDFWWYHDNTISYSLFFPDIAVPIFFKVLDDLGCEYEFDNFFFPVFLHELGHSATYYAMSEDDVEISEEATAALAAINREYEVSDYETYYYIPTEYAATKWAVEFINNHFDAVQELMDTVGAAIRRFYELNEMVTEEMVGGQVCSM